MALGISEAVDLAGRVSQLIKKGMSIELEEKIMDLRQAVMNAKGDMLALQEQNQDLRVQLADREEWEGRASQYHLTKTSGGALVYQCNNPPEHFACPACFERKVISILQPPIPDATLFHCMARDCGKQFRLRPPPRRM